MCSHFIERDSDYYIKIVDDFDELRRLKNIWNDLVENYKHYMPFISHDWFNLWLEYFLKGNRLLILLIYSKGKVITIAPLLIKEEVFKGTIKVKKIELIGNIYSPIRNFIFRESNNDEAKKVILSKIFDFFSTEFTEWDVIDLSSIPEENNFNLLKQVIKEIGLKNKEYFCFGNWYLDGISFSGDEYIQARTSNIRNNIKRYRKKLEKMGNLEFKIITKDVSLNHYIDLYYQVRKKSWKHPEKHSDFHQDLTRLAMRKGWLRFAFLFLNGIPIATQQWIICKNIAYILKLTYDQNYNKFGPGKMLTSEMMKYAIDVEKVETIDYLHGDESYKKDWTPNRRERKGITIFNNTTRGQLLAFLITRILPIIEKRQYLLSAKNMLSGYLKKHRQR